MSLIDANLLLYAYDSSSQKHAAARAWLEDTFSKPAPVRLAWATIVAFVRITTNHRVFSKPLSVAEASRHVSEWLSLPNVAPLAPTSQHWELFAGLLESGQASADLVSDAHLAALAIENGLTLYSTDRDFARFPGLSWTNPLDDGPSRATPRRQRRARR